MVFYRIPQVSYRTPWIFLSFFLSEPVPARGLSRVSAIQGIGYPLPGYFSLGHVVTQTQIEVLLKSETYRNLFWRTIGNLQAPIENLWTPMESYTKPMESHRTLYLQKTYKNSLKGNLQESYRTPIPNLQIPIGKSIESYRNLQDPIENLQNPAESQRNPQNTIDNLQTRIESFRKHMN